jgi:hypothetical protein
MSPVRSLAFVVLALLLAGPVPDAGAKPRSDAWDGRRLVVHEWGTFTTVQGSDGVVLEGLRHEERDLPPFVHDLRDYTGVSGVSPKMETPVLYFYAPTERKVRVRVRFPRGVVTQWYPAAFRVNHMRGMVNGMPATADGRVIEDLHDGYIDWGSWADLTILGRDANPALESVADDDPWRFCRAVDANTLRVCSLNRARKHQGSRPSRIEYEHEKCLFYRGLGDFPLPLEGRVLAEHASASEYQVSVRLSNTNREEALTHLFLVWVADGRCGWRYLPKLDAETRLDATLPLAPLAASTEALVAALADKLVRTGLFRKEALAMARTWQQGYFQDEGLRVLYVLPKPFIERELPLTLAHVRAAEDDRPPFHVVRTFVGRTELLSPEREAGMEAVVPDFAAGNALEQANASEALARWGRFAEPYLHRVLALTKDRDVRRIVSARLAALQLRR